MKKWQHNIELKAESLLLEYGYKGDPLKLNIEDFAHKHSFDIVTLESKQGGAKLMVTSDTISGTLIVQNGMKTIALNQLESDLRKRFTIGHELGHYFLNHGKKDGMKLDTYKLYRNEESSAGSKEEEVQANAFAAALLMPRSYITNEFNRLSGIHFDNLKIIELLSEAFGVSQISVSYRLNRLGLLATDQYIF